MRVAVACSPRGSNGRVRGSSEEGWGHRSGNGMGRAAGSSWTAMSGAQRAEMAAVVPLCSPRVNGGRRRVVVAERPSGLSACAAKVSARQGSSKRAATRGERKGGEREGREKERGQRFDSFQTQNFQLKLEKV